MELLYKGAAVYKQSSPSFKDHRVFRVSFRLLYSLARRCGAEWGSTTPVRFMALIISVYVSIEH
jgi:hypothetical protein